MCLKRDGANVGAAANTVGGASGRSNIFEQGGGGQVPNARLSRCHRHRGGMGRERGSPPIIFFLILGLEIDF